MDAEEPPDEEIARVRSGRVPSTGTSVLEELGCVQPPSTGMRSQPGTFQTPHRRDFEGCFITQAGRTVSWEEGAVGLLCGSHPASPHWDKRHSHHPGKISPGRLCRNWGQRSTIALKHAPSTFISQKTTKVVGALARSWGEKTKICISSMAMPRSLGQNVGGRRPGSLCSHKLCRGSSATWV